MSIPSSADYLAGACMIMVRRLWNIQGDKPWAKLTVLPFGVKPGEGLSLDYKVLVRISKLKYGAYQPDLFFEAHGKSIRDALENLQQILVAEVAKHGELAG